MCLCLVYVVNLHAVNGTIFSGFSILFISISAYCEIIQKLIWLILLILILSRRRLNMFTYYSNREKYWMTTFYLLFACATCLLFKTLHIADLALFDLLVVLCIFQWCLMIFLHGKIYKKYSCSFFSGMMISIFFVISSYKLISSFSILIFKVFLSSNFEEIERLSTLLLFLYPVFIFTVFAVPLVIITVMTIKLDSKRKICFLIPIAVIGVAALLFQEKLFRISQTYNVISEEVRSYKLEKASSQCRKSKTSNTTKSGQSKRNEDDIWADK